MKEIKISADLDFVYLRVDGKTNSRWPMEKGDGGTISGRLLQEAKAAAFDLLWQLESIREGSAKIIPFIN